MTPLESWIIVYALFYLVGLVLAGIWLAREVFGKMQRHIDGD